MNFHTIPNLNVDHLDPLFFEDGLIKPVPATRFNLLDEVQLRVWWHTRAIYAYPTLELVAWLREKIAGRSAIEVGAGRSCVCRALGIPLTDAKLYRRPDVEIWYQMMGQPLVVAPDDVEHLTAEQAISKYRPEVVVGCWVTQKYVEGDEADSNVYGLDEIEIVSQADYILVGNVNTHGRKRVFTLPHEEFAFPWLRTRAINPSLNRIWYFPRSQSSEKASTA